MKQKAFTEAGYLTAALVLIFAFTLFVSASNGYLTIAFNALVGLVLIKVSYLFFLVVISKEEKSADCINDHIDILKKLDEHLDEICRYLIRQEITYDRKFNIIEVNGYIVTVKVIYMSHGTNILTSDIKILVQKIDSSVIQELDFLNTMAFENLKNIINPPKRSSHVDN